jgi:hypothetical protein
VISYLSLLILVTPLDSSDFTSADSLAQQQILTMQQIRPRKIMPHPMKLSIIQLELSSKKLAEEATLYSKQIDPLLQRIQLEINLEQL